MTMKTALIYPPTCDPTAPYLAVPMLTGFLRAHGVIAERLTSTMNRWTGDHMTNSLAGRVAASVMKLSFMNAWTDGLRSAFSATMMQGFAKKAGTAWAGLDDWDRWLENVELDLQREPARILEFYRTASFRLEPVGIAYLWPVTH